MVVNIPGILSAEEATKLLEGLGRARFADGAATAGWHAREVKKNLQLTHGMGEYEPLAAIVVAALARSPVFQMALRPRVVAPILFNRYDTGMSYGPHIDDAVMQYQGRTPDRIRTDVSFTLFLSDPANYAGGELVVNAEGAAHAMKLPIGTLIAYPANSLHHVAPVTEGTRLAAVGWIQSEIRDPGQRAILFDLDVVRRRIFGQEGKSATFDLLSKSHANLLRMWIDM